MRRVFVPFTVEELAQLTYEVAMQKQGSLGAWQALRVRDRQDWLTCVGLVLETIYPDRATRLIRLPGKQEGSV